MNQLISLRVTIDEFDLIRDGDKILVGLSGGSSSVCLLHLLRQFSRARGLNITIGAVTFAEEGSNFDPRALMLYMRNLKIEFFYEIHSEIGGMKHNLSLIARKRGFTTVALGSTIEKLADGFLSSILYRGKMHAKTPFSRNSESDLKIIRPFLFVRERNLEEFSISRNLPSRPSKIFTQMPDGVQSILKVQEILNPNVYENIKKAIQHHIINKSRM